MEKTLMSLSQDLKSVDEMFKSHGHIVLHLPSYSPDLKRIEEKLV
jgi:transposase